MIALLTDFGITDPYVGSLKAAIYNITEKQPIIDVCHHIRPQNILQGAFVLRMVYRDYPQGTIFVCVVDPGVGSKRLPVAIQTGDHFFIGPDNGIFSYIYSREQIKSVVQLTNEKLWRHPVSSTFHGRDIFAPCAAWLSEHSKIGELGQAYSEKLTQLDLLAPEQTPDGSLQGCVMHIDRFGNLITNIHEDVYAKKKASGTPILDVCNWDIPVGTYYGQVPKESLLAVWGSSGFLEISARNGSACDILDCDLQEPVVIEFRSPDS